MSNLQKSEKGGEIVKINKIEYLKKYDPVQVLTSLQHIKTMEQAITDDSNCIAFYSKKIGQDSILALIELHLMALSESVNVGQPLTKYQIKEIAIEIHSMFYFLSMTEICYVLRKAKRGEYGQLYGALNIVAILDWFNQYSEDRAQRFITQSTKDRQNDYSARSQERKEIERNDKLQGRK